jgi:ABC-type multidrug transport system fused ATPase/permease subunit
MKRLRLWGELLARTARMYPARTLGLLLVKVFSTTSVAASALAMRALVNGVVAGDARAALLAATLAASSFATTVYLGNLDTTLRVMLIDSVAQLHLTGEIQTDVASLDGLEHLERTDFQDRLEQVRNAGWAVVAGAFIAADVAFSAIQLLIMLILLSTVSPWLTILLPLTSVPIWFDQRSRRRISQSDIDTAEAMRTERHLFNLAIEAAGGKELRVAGAGAELTRIQAQAWNEAVVHRTQARVHAALWKLIGWTIYTILFAAGLGLVAYKSARGTGSIGDIVLAITIAVAMRDSIVQTVWRASAVSHSQVTEPYLWLRDYVAAQRKRARGHQHPPDRLSYGITLNRVAFTYPGTDRHALQEASCYIPAGSVVAVVGEYGSGKTSLVKLLMKFYQPNEGAITVDGVDLADIDTEVWRSRTSAAFQDFSRFQIRFGETVGVGDLSRLDDLQCIADAIKVADAQDLVDRLPDGLDTQLGRRFDGVELSEGQWQKTALARASMRVTPLLFVLDEPTASLDAPSEQAIFGRYIIRARQLSAQTGAITVIVSHRLSTVTGADLILVLDKGRLVEHGSHEHLLAHKGRYAELYSIHAKAYAS